MRDDTKVLLMIFVVAWLTVLVSFAVWTSFFLLAAWLLDFSVVSCLAVGYGIYTFVSMKELSFKGAARAARTANLRPRP